MSEHSDWILEVDPGPDGLSKVEVRFNSGTIVDGELATLWRFEVVDGHPVGHPHPGWEYQAVRDRATFVLACPLPLGYADRLAKMDVFYQLARIVGMHRSGRVVVGTLGGQRSEQITDLQLNADAIILASEWQQLRRPA